MIYPKHLEKGYKIGVTAPSAGIEKELDQVRFENAIKQFEALGYPVVATNNVRTCIKGRSSDGPTRAKELMQLIHDPEIRAIIAYSGGDYLMEMLSHVDFDAINKHPKWIQGYSDITGLLFTITTNLDIATIYSNNFSAFGMARWHTSLKDNLSIMEGQDIRQDSFDRYQDGFLTKVTGLEEFALDKEVKWRNLYSSKAGQEDELHIKGRALGGCLDVILNLIGTRFDKTKEFIQKYKEDQILWFLESYDLSSEALTRGLWQLKEAGWFEHAAGFVFGRPAFFQSYYDISYDEAVLSVLGELNLPIILDADIGHKPPQFAMINGAFATVQSGKGRGSILFERR